jgi:hypothetical protein
MIIQYSSQNKEVAFRADAGIELYPDEAKLAFTTLESKMLEMLRVLKADEAVPGSGLSRTPPCSGSALAPLPSYNSHLPSFNYKIISYRVREIDP